MREEVDILAVDAHICDEVAYGMALAAHVRQGKKVAMLHLTPGEKGHPTLSPEEYAKMKHAEAQEAAAVFGAELYTLDYKDGELPVSDAVQFGICDVIRACKPKVLLTHWQGSIHKDHTNCALNIPNAIFYAAIKGFQRAAPPHWVPRLHFAENWEDKEGFEPELYLEVTEEDIALWETAMLKYALFRGGVSRFPYMDYYRAQARVRGCEIGYQYAVAFAVPPASRRRKVTTLL
jgi:LmbE family N-acetylglucosaminyl deacetylase